MSWKGGQAQGATTDDVCKSVQLKPTAGPARGGDPGKGMWRQLAFTPHETDTLHCAAGSWGPGAAGGTVIYFESADVMALPWYDGALLKLQRAR